WIIPAAFRQVWRGATQPHCSSWPAT
ncbi:MAG: ATP synthase delta chain, partial [uncultured Sphingomonadaceae bacterium]